MRKGEIWRVRLPTQASRTQAGERPAAIVQNDSVTAQLPTVIVGPFTSQARATRVPGTLLVQPDPRNGLAAPSVALGFQLLALDKMHFLSRYGELDGLSLAQLLKLLTTLTT